MKRYLISLLIGLAAGPVWAAQPVINSATAANADDGSVVTLAGSNFGAKNPAKPIIWANFEDGSNNPSSDGQFTSWDVRNAISVVSSGTMVGESQYMLRGVVRANQSDNPRVAWESLGRLTTVYIQMDRMYSYSSASLPNNRNHKVIRLNPFGGYSGTTNDYVASAISGGIAFNECDTEYPNRNTGGIDWGANSARNERWFWQWSGSATFHMNGTLKFQNTDVPNCEQVLAEVSIDNLASDPPASEGSIWIDNIYIDTVTSRIGLSEFSTIAAATDMRPCIPQTWTDGEATCKIAHSGTMTGPLYAYVWNERNEVNASGFQITTDGGTPATPAHGRNRLRGNSIMTGRMQ